jgi:hypothetical protein
MRLKELNHIFDPHVAEERENMEASVLMETDRDNMSQKDYYDYEEAIKNQFN